MSKLLMQGALHNEGILDRAVRILLGIALLGIFFAGPKTAWGLLGFVPLFTGLVGNCPLYRVLGISTCRHSSEQGPAHS